MSSDEAAPFGPDDLTTMWRVVANWVRATPREAVGATLARQLDQFNRIEADVLEHSVPRRQLPFKLSESFGWIVGGRLPRYGRRIIPVASVSVGRAPAQVVEELTFRVALLSVREDGTLAAEGWRFETPEVDASGDQTEATQTESRSAHPYAHVQAIYGWERDSPCLIHPPHGQGDECDGVDLVGVQALDEERLRAARSTLDTHPAFPLPATTLTGLAVSVILSLYGATPTRQLIQGDGVLQRVTGPIKHDLDVLLARAE